MRRGKIVVSFLVFIVIGIFILGAFGLGVYLAERKHGSINVEGDQFKESSKILDNPNRGFYAIYGFAITDQWQNYEEQIAQKFCYDTNSLAQIQINLRNYPNGAITKAGMRNVEKLFEALSKKNKQYIIRFLYDWNGKGTEAEPKSIDIILMHMEQLETIFHKYKDIIFVHQGIFVGDCGEMHGSKYLSAEDMETLFLQLKKVTEAANTYLSVRTPQHWRMLTKLLETKNIVTHEWANRLGLYNDGMMGTIQDTGTYGTQRKEEADVFEKWNREDELAFQNELCKIVPNGGEVIIENPINDFENAIKDMSTMHITYLNSQYDQAVLNKWAEAIVKEDSCFNGMDGLSYVERHLGYRLLINKADFSYDFWPDILTVNVTLQNVGFAPMYRQPKVYCVISNTDGSEIRSFEIQEDVRILTGGNETEKLLTISKDISLAGFEAGEYNIYFCMKDTASGKQILLANEQDEEVLGYKLGQITIEPLINPITGKEFDFKSIVDIWLH